MDHRKKRTKICAETSNNFPGISPLLFDVDRFTSEPLEDGTPFFIFGPKQEKSECSRSQNEISEGKMCQKVSEAKKVYAIFSAIQNTCQRSTFLVPNDLRELVLAQKAKTYG